MVRGWSWKVVPTKTAMTIFELKIYPFKWLVKSTCSGMGRSHSTPTTATIPRAICSVLHNVLTADLCGSSQILIAYGYQ